MTELAAELEERGFSDIEEDTVTVGAGEAGGVGFRARADQVHQQGRDLRDRAYVLRARGLDGVRGHLRTLCVGRVLDDADPALGEHRLEPGGAVVLGTGQNYRDHSAAEGLRGGLEQRVNGRTMPAHRRPPGHRDGVTDDQEVSAGRGDQDDPGVEPILVHRRAYRQLGAATQDRGQGVAPARGQMQDDQESGGEIRGKARQQTLQGGDATRAGADDDGVWLVHERPPGQSLSLSLS